MIVQGVKSAASIIVYGILLAIGFRIGQKAYEYAESHAQEDLGKLINITKEVVNDTYGRFSSGKETGD